MDKLTMDEFLGKFGQGARGAIRELAAREDVTHFVLFENQDMCSSRLGDRTAIIVGPGCTYKDLEEVEGQHLNDLPSQRQYPVAFVATREEENEKEVESAGADCA